VVVTQFILDLALQKLDQRPDDQERLGARTWCSSGEMATGESPRRRETITFQTRE
jgi:hypothetical protein